MSKFDKTRPKPRIISIEIPKKRIRIIPQCGVATTGQVTHNICSNHSEKETCTSHCLPYKKNLCQPQFRKRNINEVGYVCEQSMCVASNSLDSHDRKKRKIVDTDVPSSNVLHSVVSDTTKIRNNTDIRFSDRSFNLYSSFQTINFGDQSSHDQSQTRKRHINETGHVDKNVSCNLQVPNDSSLHQKKSKIEDTIHNTSNNVSSKSDWNDSNRHANLINTVDECQSSVEYLSQTNTICETDKLDKAIKNVNQDHTYFRNASKKNFANSKRPKRSKQVIDLNESLILRVPERRVVQLIDSSQDDQFNENTVQPHYAGPMNLKCTACGAKHFQQEKVQNHSTFNSCCNHGQVSFDLFSNYPNELKELFNGSHPKSRHFLQNIRSYNCAFQMASFNTKICDFNDQRPGPYCFKIQGDIYYQINTSLRPEQNENPSFGQLFLYDSLEATNFRKSRFQNLDSDLVMNIDMILRRNNPFVQSYLMVREHLDNHAITEQNSSVPRPLSLAFTQKEGLDPRRYNVQKCNEVAVLFSTTADGDIPDNFIVIKDRATKQLRKLSSLDPKVEPWTYPLYFPDGKFGWRPGIKKKRGNRTVTRLQYFKYITSIRDEFNPILHGGRLFQQYVVDMAVKIEKDRLDWCRTHQDTLKVDCYEEVMKYKDAVNSSSTPNRIGKITVLPATFIGSRRNMQKRYRNAMRLVGKFGLPHIFITKTCNPNHKEIVENLSPSQQSSDRPDLVSRVFHIKSEDLLHTLVNNKLWGAIAAFIGVIEFQKRGLPHLHALITFKNRPTQEMIDQIVCAEIPPQDTEPIGHEKVMKHMIHGPCGDWCEIDGRCSKNFPKPFQNETVIGDNNYPAYRRRDTGITYMKNENFEVDNRYVVPYNKTLLLKYDSHINVEFISHKGAVKYLFKYVYKGHDAASIDIASQTDKNSEVGPNGEHIVVEDQDEISFHVQQRYMGPCEGFTRAHYSLFKMSHSVINLPIHLPNQHSIVLEENIEMMDVEELESKQTMLMDFFELNKRSEKARSLTYQSIPEFFTFSKVEVNGKKIDMWVERKKFGMFPPIGRINDVSPSNQELFHLRILLLYAKGPTSFDDLKTVDGIVQNSFVQTCLIRGLVEDDREWIRAMTDAVTWMMPKQLRCLFARILIFCHPKKPAELWETFRSRLCEDFRRHQSENDSVTNALKHICWLVMREGKNLQDVLIGIEIPEIRNDDLNVLGNTITINRSIDHSYESCNSDQQKVIDTILVSLNISPNVESRNSNCFFIHGPGGSGKTYVYWTLNKILEDLGKNVCMMAYTGIAATLLPNGRTIHKVFNLPVPILSDSSANIKNQSKNADYLRSVDVFLIDEAPMAPRYTFEIIDRTLKHITGKDEIFGGKIIILGGDFKQIPPVLSGSIPSEIIDISLKSSSLWNSFTSLFLHKNMRALNNEIEFADFLVKLGKGQLNGPNDEIKLEYFPERCIVRDTVTSMIRMAFGRLIQKNDFVNIQNSVILSTRNDDVNEINDKVVELFDETTETIYEAFDTIDYSENEGLGDSIDTEYLNSLNPNSLPPFKLRLRRNCIIMLIRNLNIDEGLCNGTRLMVLEMRQNAILCRILTGNRRGDKVFLCRISITCDNDYLFSFKRLQFPVKLAFAMTINKAQGQTFDNVYIDLRQNVFTHGQLYVALSRVRSWDFLRIFLDPDVQQDTIKNYVFRELLIEYFSGQIND